MGDWKEEFLSLRFSKDGTDSHIKKAYDLKYENQPKSIFKYMKFDKDGHSLEHFINNTTWLSNPSDFNDPFDSVINIDFLKINHDSIIKNYIEIARSKHKVPEEVLDKAKNNQKPVEYLTEYILSKLGLDDTHIARYLKFDNDINTSRASEARWNFVYDLRSKIRVGSFSENFNHMLMWAHYSDSHKGFCIEYDLSTTSKGDLNLRLLYPVNYSDDLTDFTDQFELLEKNKKLDVLWAKKAAVFKAKVWEYESEWRLIFSEDNLKERLHKFLPIKSVYVGAKIAEKNRENILTLAKSRSIDVFRMYISDNKFGLEFEKIS